MLRCVQVIVKGQTVSAVWELSFSADVVDRPLDCNFHVSYRPLNDDSTSDTYSYKHSFSLPSCRVSFITLVLLDLIHY